MITVPKELVDFTIDELRRCGGLRRECVVFWTAAQWQPQAVIGVSHPSHRSSSYAYEVDDAWLTRFFFTLSDQRRTAVAQVHSHPGPWVGHSSTDDAFVLVPTAGFVSIVVPHFGRVSDIGQWGIHVLQPSGAWRPEPTAVRW
jgi:hypothetical protein